MISIREAFLESGRNLRQIRVEKNISVAALAVLSGVDHEIIEAMEEGHFDFSMDILFDLAAALNVDFREILLDRTPDTK
jgi:transcriptional regulator with XRE-family HTH domain